MFSARTITVIALLVFGVLQSAAARQFGRCDEVGRCHFGGAIGVLRPKLKRATPVIPIHELVLRLFPRQLSTRLKALADPFSVVSGVGNGIRIGNQRWHTWLISGGLSYFVPFPRWWGSRDGRIPSARVGLYFQTTYQLRVRHSPLPVSSPFQHEFQFGFGLKTEVL